MKGPSHIQIRITTNSLKLVDKANLVMNITLASPVTFLVDQKDSSSNKSSVVTLTIDNILEDQKDVCIMIAVQVLFKNCAKYREKLILNT